MKKHASILALVALSCISYGADTLDIALRKLEPDTNKPIPKAQIATSNFSYGLLDKNNVIRLSAWEGALKYQGTFNKYQTTLVFTDPTAARTITLPNSSGTVLLTSIDSWVFDGVTADANKTTLSVVDPTGTNSIVLPNGSGTVFLTSLATNKVDVANSVTGASNALLFEGATADAFETTLSPVDPTADQTASIPNFAVNFAILGSTLTTNTVDAANSIWGTSNNLVFEGATADSFETFLTLTDPTADRTITLPNASGTVRVAQASTATALTADDQVVTPGQANVIQLSSDNATATNRTFTLSATGAITGAIYIIIGPATNGCEIADTGIQKLSATWTPTTTDTLTLIFDGTNYVELSRAANH